MSPSVESLKQSSQGKRNSDRRESHSPIVDCNVIPQPDGILYASANRFFFSSGEHLTSLDKIKKFAEHVEVAYDVIPPDTSSVFFRNLNLLTANNSRSKQCITNEDETIMEVGGGDLVLNKRNTQ